MKKKVIAIAIFILAMPLFAFAQNNFLFQNLKRTLDNPTGLRAKAKLLDSQAKNILTNANNLKKNKQFDLKERFGPSKNKDFYLPS